MIKKLHLKFYLILSILSISINAQARLFDVEILVFERTGAAYLNAEHWSKTLRPFNAKNGHPIPKATPFLLKSAAYSLRKNGFNILTLVRWRTNAVSKNHAPWYQLSDGRKLSGLVRISLKRYLHAEFDLKLKQHTNNSDGFSHQQTFYLKAHRKMRSKTLHYIDHPRMGVLIKIMPVTAKKPTANPPL